jgi:hypothetical protein
MRVPNLRLAAIALAGGLTLGGCAYGYDPYGGGYGGVSVGYGYNDYGYYNPYYYGGYGRPYGYGGYYGGSPYYGWYDGFYYPGTGYYVYDRYRRAHRWTDAQRDYWEWRRKGSRSGDGGGARAIEHWGDFNPGVQVINGQNGSSTVRTRTIRMGDSASGTATTRSHTVRIRGHSDDGDNSSRRRHRDND